MPEGWVQTAGYNGFSSLRSATHAVGLDASEIIFEGPPGRSDVDSVSIPVPVLRALLATQGLAIVPAADVVTKPAISWDKLRKEPCGNCGGYSRMSTAGCDHCDHEDK